MKRAWNYLVIALATFLLWVTDIFILKIDTDFVDLLLWFSIFGSGILIAFLN